MVPRIGTEFAGYRIVALLGKGGMSVVYRAENPRLGTTVALKILAPELAEDEAFRERFVGESRTAAALNHPNIITIYDAGEADGVLYIVMRFVRSDLRATVNEYGPLDPYRAATILEQAASALDSAHAAELIHRDVKPANILLDGGDGRPEVAYLADFGLTKRAGTRSGPTSSGAFLGTIDYMAPEQINNAPLDGRADLYSLGCVAFNCLTGKPPFPRDNDPAVLFAHTHDPPPRASDLRPGLPSGIDAAIARALAKDPDERFQTCGDFAAALTASLDGEQTVERTRRFPQPSPAPAQVEPTAAPGLRPERRRRRPGRLLALVAALLVAAGAGALAALAVFEDEPEPVERLVVQTRTVSASPDGLTDFDRDLLLIIPTSFRETCEPIEPIAVGFDATVRCRPGPGVGFADYSHARSGDILQSYIRGRVVTVGVPLEEDGALPKLGECGTSTSAVREWTASGRAGHEETDSDLLELQGYGDVERQQIVDGHVLCYAQRARYWIEWTDQQNGTYAQATGANAATLVDWWETSAGPVNPRP